MKTKNSTLIIFLSLILSSCGLIEKFSTPETANESTDTKTETAAAPSDDLFSDTQKMSENTPPSTGTDAPSNVTTEKILEPQNNQDELAALQNEFSNSAPAETAVKPVEKVEAEIKPDLAEAMSEPMKKVVESKPAKKPTPLKVKEQPVIDTSMEEASIGGTTGNIKNYKVQKGETLMHIAFKIYGDISRWKDLRRLNGDKLSSNSALRAGLTLKYDEPEQEFVWNPEGNPYMIKNGETLGTISNTVYQTPKKWKTIWENNKPLIKNPNMIYAGFTIYYKSEGLSNYVQPKKEQAKKVATKFIPIDSPTATPIEEVKVENALTEIERLNSTSEEINDIRSATVRNTSVSAPAQEDTIPDTAPTPLPDDGSEVDPPILEE